jgi:hypothetical protein
MKPTVLAIHRGYTITDEPYGSEPFTIYTPENRVLDHCDECTIKQCMDTIDVIEDEHEANERREKERGWYPGACFDRSYPENYSNIRA